MATCPRQTLCKTPFGFEDGGGAASRGSRGPWKLEKVRRHTRASEDSPAVSFNWAPGLQAPNQTQQEAKRDPLRTQPSWHLILDFQSQCCGKKEVTHDQTVKPRKQEITLSLVKVSSTC